MTTGSQIYSEASQDDEQAIRGLVETWLRASERKDLETILPLMEDDVVFITAGNEPFGKEAFARGFESMKNIKLECVGEIQEIRVLGEWAYVHNFLRITFTQPDGTAKKHSGHILSILHKGTDGQWRIARDANQVLPENEEGQ
ncbi:MAG TPA: SgcJ/EcaC family oxidoreductase [Pyrinomonadaceae bacterium]